MAAEKSIAYSEGSTSSKTQVSCPGLVSCSVCLEAVTDAGERSIAKLKCGHHFHLDCIGSAFNAKGRMQCPNCRQVEHGQWLYANGCFLHEDFVDDLTYEDDSEVYGGAPNLQFGHTPWCPHQGSYAHFSLTLEEIDNVGNGYLDPMVNMRQGSRASVAGQICPYLAAEGLSMGGPLHHVEDLLALQIGHHSSRNSRRAAAFSSAHRSRWQRQTSAGSATSSIPTLYEGVPQNYNPSGRFVQPSANRHRNSGAYFGSPPSVHSGANQGPNHSGNVSSGPFFTQPSQSRGGQGINGNSNFQPSTATRNGYFGSRRPRHSAVVLVPSQRALQVSSSERLWMHDRMPEFGAWGAPGNLGQNPNHILGGDGMGWGADNQVDSWTRGGTYAPQAPFGTSNHWWAWVPPGTNHGQSAMPNTVSSGYHEGQFYGTGLFPRSNASSQGFVEHHSESGYAWSPPGFR